MMKIIVNTNMDKLPKSCLQCKYCGFYENHHGLILRKGCAFAKDKVITKTKRPKYCPLETIDE